MESDRAGKSELQTDGIIKIGYGKHIAAGIAGDMLGAVTLTEAFCFAVETTAHKCINDGTRGRVMFFFETQDGDHSVFGISQAKIGNAFTHFARAFDIGGRGQNQDGDATVGGGEGVLIDIDHVECVDVTDGRVGDGRGNKRKCGEEKELKCSPAHE